MDDAQIREALASLWRRVDAQRAIWITLLDALATRNDFDMKEFIDDLQHLVRSGRQTNQPSETIREARLLVEALSRKAPREDPHRI